MIKTRIINTLFKILLVVTIFLSLSNKIYAFKVNNFVLESVDDINNIDNTQKVDGLTVADENGTMFTYVESQSKFIEQTNTSDHAPSVESVDTTWLVLDNLSKEIELNGHDFNYNSQFIDLPGTVVQTILEITPNYAKIQLQDIGTTNYDPTPISFSNHENWANAPNLQIQKKTLYPIEENTTLITGEYYQITTNTPSRTDLSNYDGVNYIGAIYKALNDVTISTDVRLFAYDDLEKTSFSNLDPPYLGKTYSDGTIAKNCQEYYDNGFNDYDSDDGTYIISIDGTQEKYVYCDMSHPSSGGIGWMLVFKAEGGITSDTDPLPIERIADEQGEVDLCLSNLDDNCSAKLSDDYINILAKSSTGSSTIAYRFSSPDIANNYYGPRGCVYSQVNSLSNDSDHDCRKLRYGYPGTNNWSYHQCDYWSNNVVGFDAWYNCRVDGYTNVLATGRYFNSSGDHYTKITPNSNMDQSDSFYRYSTNSPVYTYDLYMWVSSK